MPEPPPDPSPAERRRAVIVAGHAGDRAAARAALADTDPRVRASALGAVARSGALTPGQVLDALGDPVPSVRVRAAELAGRRAADGGDGPDAALDEALVACLDDGDPTVVVAAAWALGERETAPATEALATVATGHADPLCRESAAAALGAIGDPGGLDAILVACTDVVTVRRRAVLALAPYDGDEVERALRAAAQDKDWQVRQAAEDLLGDA